MPSCVTVATCSISKFAFPHEKQVYEFDWRTEGELGEHLNWRKETGTRELPPEDGETA